MNLRSFVNDVSLYSDWLEWVAAEKEKVRTFLERADKPEDIYRLQGEVRLLNKLSKLREEINGKGK